MGLMPGNTHAFLTAHLHMLDHIGVYRALEAVVLGAVFLTSAAGNTHWAFGRSSG